RVRAYDPVGVVAHQQRDARALADVHGDESSRDGSHRLVQFAVRERTALVGDRIAVAPARGDVVEEAAERQRADTRFLGQRGTGVVGARHQPGSSTSTGPFAITDPSWLVMVTRMVRTLAPRVRSSRLSVTVPSRNVTSPSKAGNRYCTFEWRTKPS